jgi:hypothetical protein
MRHPAYRGGGSGTTLPASTNLNRPTAKVSSRLSHA